MQQVQAEDGARLGLQVTRSTEGVPVLVLPGGPCRGPEYLGDFAGLGGVRPLAIIDLRGTPVTGGLSRGWWTDAVDVIAVADHLGLEEVDIVAHSAGTRLALAVAAQHPGRVRSLALVTPAAVWLTGTTHDGATLAVKRPEPAVARAMASMHGPQPDGEQSFRRALEVEAPAGYARWAVREQRHAFLGEMSLASASAWFTDIPADAGQRVLEAALPPTLVVGGSDDILSGVEPVRAYVNALGARVTFIDRCGHYPWIEQPTAFRRAVGGWISEQRAFR